MSASMLVSCVGVVTCPGRCPIAKETALAAPTLCTESGPNGWNNSFARSILVVFLKFGFLDPRGGSRSLTHVVVLVDFFVSQPTVFIETS